MKDLNISYSEATIIHANKYNQNTGIVVSSFFFSNICQDVVFKMENSGTEFPATFNNGGFPLYTGQKVTLIAVNHNVIAYLDKSTNKYYYLTGNLQRDLKLWYED